MIWFSDPLNFARQEEAQTKPPSLSSVARLLRRVLERATESLVEFTKTQKPSEPQEAPLSPCFSATGTAGWLTHVWHRAWEGDVATRDARRAVTFQSSLEPLINIQSEQLSSLPPWFAASVEDAVFILPTGPSLDVGGAAERKVHTQLSSLNKPLLMSDDRLWELPALPRVSAERQRVRLYSY